MLLLIPAYSGGVLTILSTCILPVLPFIFARADRPFAHYGLPMLMGMALIIVVVATLATVGGGWAIRTHQYGRIVAPPRLASPCSPIVAFSNKLTLRRESEDDSVLWAAGLGVAPGLWAPCAGPILALLVWAGVAAIALSGVTAICNARRPYA
jgi:cytochrome c biogenesis protein CcdA